MNREQIKRIRPEDIEILPAEPRDVQEHPLRKVGRILQRVTPASIDNAVRVLLGLVFFLALIKALWPMLKGLFK